MDDVFWDSVDNHVVFDESVFAVKVEIVNDSFGDRVDFLVSDISEVNVEKINGIEMFDKHVHHIIVTQNSQVFQNREELDKNSFGVVVEVESQFYSLYHFQVEE